MSSLVLSTGLECFMLHQDSKEPTCLGADLQTRATRCHALNFNWFESNALNFIYCQVSNSLRTLKNRSVLQIPYSLLGSLWWFVHGFYSWSMCTGEKKQLTDIRTKCSQSRFTAKDGGYFVPFSSQLKLGNFKGSKIHISKVHTE